MSDYSKGVIYTIRCRYDTSLIYVGSTICALCKRWGGHKSACFNPNCTAYNLPLYQKIRETCWSDWYIELYEEYPCENVQQLRKREGEVIREIGTLNKNVAGRDEKEWREVNKKQLAEQKKQYYEENKERLSEYHKQYYQDNYEKHREKTKQYYEENKQKMIEKAKQYYEKNKKQLAEQKKQYYEENKERLSEYNKQYHQKYKIKMAEKLQCECGALISRNNIITHRKTQKHQDLMASAATN